MRNVEVLALLALGTRVSPTAALHPSDAVGTTRRQFASHVGTAGAAAVAASALLVRPELSGASPSTFAAGVAAGASDGASSVAATLGDTAAAAAAATMAAGPLTVSNGQATFPPMGLGAWAWGDALFWGYRPSEDEELAKVFEYAAAQGSGCFFDTAELYGIGRSESLIGKFAKKLEDPSRCSVATKFAALPWRVTRQSVVTAAKDSVKRLGGTPIELYQIHFPGPWANEAYWDGLGDAYEQGLVKAVGVSNYGSDALRACHAKLASRGIPLVSNQVQCSLLYRCPLDNGLKDTADELGIRTIAYSPLALGLLSGKYGPGHLPSGPRKALAAPLFAAPAKSSKTTISAADGLGTGAIGATVGDDATAAAAAATANPAFNGLLSTMNAIAMSRGSVPLTQVALNWCIAQGTTPIPGVRSLQQVEQNLGALKWSLSTGELEALNEAAAPLPPLLAPEKAQFPKFDVGTGLVMFDS